MPTPWRRRSPTSGPPRTRRPLPRRTAPVPRDQHGRAAGIGFDLIMGRPGGDARRRTTSTRSPASCRPVRSRASRGQRVGPSAASGWVDELRSWQQEPVRRGERRSRDGAPPVLSPPGLPLALRRRRRPVAVGRRRERAHVPRRLRAVQRDHPDHRRDPGGAAHRAPGHHGGGLQQRPEPRPTATCRCPRTWRRPTTRGSCSTTWPAVSSASTPTS